ncbi:MAG: ribosome biogenesis GTPase Der, partial [Candidatus Doudnabacteria bacterium]|nr:ribosome biogenesis GTPase Der [Candidatus Doudnabacteria bacterium]
MDSALPAQKPQEAPAVGDLPTVAIIGRPNVGKSTLFNRLLGMRRSVTTPIPGTTRDRIEASTTWNGRTFTLVDTAGIEGESVEQLEEDVASQIAFARDNASVLLFVIDMQGGLTGADRTTADMLRKLDTPVLLIANKSDSQVQRQAALQETARLGLGEPVVVSASSGAGSGDVLDAIVDALGGPSNESGERPHYLRLGIFGRPNVGKSTLLNALTGEDRAIVSDVSGTTRDTIDMMLETEQGPVQIVDTAGIRRKAKIAKESIDEWVTKESLRTLRRSDVALLLIDADEPITAQDRRLANRALTDGVGLIVIVNKWDLIRAQQEEGEDGDVVFKQFQKNVRRSFPFLQHVPILTISAEHGRGIDQIIPTVWRIHQNRTRRISEKELAETLGKIIKKQGFPTNEKGDDMEFEYLRQAEGVPPLFMLKTKRLKDVVPRPYLNIIEKELRATHDFDGVTVKVQ